MSENTESDLNLLTIEVAKALGYTQSSSHVGSTVREKFAIYTPDHKQVGESVLGYAEAIYDRDDMFERAWLNALSEIPNYARSLDAAYSLPLSDGFEMVIHRAATFTEVEIITESAIVAFTRHWVAPIAICKVWLRVKEHYDA